MKHFEYKARDKSGQLITGTMGAEHAQAVAHKLEQLGYLPIDIVLRPPNRVAGSLWTMFETVTLSEINLFTRQLFTLQRSGLPLLGSLGAIKAQTTNLKFKTAIEQIVRDIEAGSNLSDALEKQKDIFTPLYISMIRTGEVSGRLPEILERLAILGEEDAKVRIRILSAVRYPLMVLAAICLGFLGLITVVIPRFIKIYSRFDTELPLATKILIAMHQAVTHYGWLLLGVFALCVVIVLRYINTEQGRAWKDRVVIRLPVLGPLYLKMAISRFCRITGTLMKSGVPILQILELVEQSVGNSVVGRAVRDIRQSVNEGKGMLEPMRQCGLFAPIVLQMVAVGEETAKVDELLIHVADYYDSQIDFTINNLVSLIEPLLILIMGAVVLVMALGIFMPMWGLMRVFRH